LTTHKERRKPGVGSQKLPALFLQLFWNFFASGPSNTVKGNRGKKEEEKMTGKKLLAAD